MEHVCFGLVTGLVGIAGALTGEKTDFLGLYVEKEGPIWALKAHVRGPSRRFQSSSWPPILFQSEILCNTAALVANQLSAETFLTVNTC